MAFHTSNDEKAVSALVQQGTTSLKTGKRKAGSLAASEVKRPRHDLDAKSSLFHAADSSDPDYVLNDVEGENEEAVEEEEEYDECEFTDGEQQDEVVDTGKPADIDYDRLHRNFMKKWSVKGQGMQMNPIEVFQCQARFRGRITHVLKTWIDAARSISYAEMKAEADDLPMKMGMWRLFVKLGLEETVDQILKDTPEVVQVVLGRPGPLTLQIIDELPCDLSILFAVYVDLTKHLEEDFFDPYVGSATGKKGADQRCSTYYRISENGTIPPSTTGRHERHIVQPEVQVNVRILWLNNPNDRTSKLTSVAEQMWSSFFGCQRSPSRTAYATSRAIEIGEAALPADFRSMKHRGLNDAFQMLQYPIWKREHRPQPKYPLPADKKCENCSVPEGPLGPGRSGFFYFLRKWKKWVCITCYEYARLHDDALRPASLYQKVISVSAKGKKPEICPKCNTAPKRWAFSKYSFRWLCNACKMAEHRKGLKQAKEQAGK